MLQQMSTQPLQLEPFSEENKKFFRAFNWLAVIGLGIAVCITFFLTNACIEESRLINMFIDAVAALVPAVKHVAASTPEPTVARFVLASQWLLFPFYFYILFCAQPPWGKISRKRMAQSILRRKAEKQIGKTLFVMVIFLMMTIPMLLSDFRISHWAPSFLTGSIFDSGALLLSTQKISLVGVVLVSWLSPMLEVGLYLLVLMGFSWLQLFFSGDFEKL